jgi:hypothetical protein
LRCSRSEEEGLLVDFSDDQRRVLLIDCDSVRQPLRVAALRNHEIEVHTASNIADAGHLCRRYFYDLVLLAAEKNSEEAALLSHELGNSKPRQRLALLVGAPQYVCEVGHKRSDRQSADKSLVSSQVPGRAQPEPSQRQLMMDRLSAAALIDTL